MRLGRSMRSHAVARKIKVSAVDVLGTRVSILHALTKHNIGVPGRLGDQKLFGGNRNG
jgi:hypothetical protein